MEFTSYDWVVISAVIFNTAVGVIGFLLASSRRRIAPHYGIGVMGIVAFSIVGVMLVHAIAPITSLLWGLLMLILYVVNLTGFKEFTTTEWRGWVVSFDRLEFYPNLPRRKGQINWNPFVHYEDGFKMWHEEIRTTKGLMSTYTLVIKATEKTIYKAFEYDKLRFHIYQHLLSLVEKGASKQEIAEYISGQIGEKEIGIVEIQNPKYAKLEPINILQPAKN